MHRGITIHDNCLIGLTLEQTMDILWNYHNNGYQIHYDGDHKAWVITP